MPGSGSEKPDGKRMEVKILYVLWGQQYTLLMSTVVSGRGEVGWISGPDLNLISNFTAFFMQSHGCHLLYEVGPA